MSEKTTSITRAVIVAAGRSLRLHPLTENTPKALLDVGGEAMLPRSVRLLRERGVREIAVVVGHQRGQIERALGDDGISYLYNPFYAETNNMGSLWFARAWVGGESFLYLHADLVYDPRLLERMLEVPEDGDAALLVDVGPTDEEAMKVRVSADGCFESSSKEIPLDEALGEWTGIARFSGRFSAALFDAIEALLAEREFMVYDTCAFTRLAAAGRRFCIVETGELPWIEVDFAKDLGRAREMFG